MKTEPNQTDLGKDYMESDEDDDEDRSEDESEKFEYDWNRVGKWLLTIEDENLDASG